MIILTPPFQVPDEQEHFHRAYQLSELQLRGTVQDGAAGGILPSSLVELSVHFLGARAIHAERRITAQPLRYTRLMLGRPLDPNRREFVDFTSAAFFSPMGYVPQAIAIVGGRSAGAGPLMLLYLARLANALVALVLVSSAVWLMPIAPEAVMVAGLLPMAVFEYASAAPDAGVIGTAFLFTSVALRAQLRGGWTAGEVAVAAVSGLVFCSQKPVYAPLLVLGLPAALTGGRARQILLAHAVIVVVALGGTAFWIVFSWSHVVLAVPGTNLARQAGYISAYPFAFAWTIARTFRYYHTFYYQTLIGVLGWAKLYLPGFAYFLAPSALMLSVLAQPRDAPRLPVYAVAWNVLLLAGIVLLIMTALYLSWTPVGCWVVEGNQGRYFLLLLPVAIASVCSVIRWRPFHERSRAVSVLVSVIIAVQLVIAAMAIVQAYQVF